MRYTYNIKKYQQSRAPRISLSTRLLYINFASLARPGSTRLEPSRAKSSWRYFVRARSRGSTKLRGPKNKWIAIDLATHINTHAPTSASSEEPPLWLGSREHDHETFKRSTSIRSKATYCTERRLKVTRTKYDAN